MQGLVFSMRRDLKSSMFRNSRKCLYPQHRRTALLACDLHGRQAASYGDDLRPTFLGHSVGHWEGDTLVIDSVGFNEKQWFSGSYPITEKLHLTERISRPSLKSLSYEYTVDDPGAYTGPWSGRWTITEKGASSFIADGELFEYICQDSR
jgi:hypothetical protein